MVDCRSLIEFCKAFDQHKNLGVSDNRIKNRSKKNNNYSVNPLSHPFCDHSSPFAAVDIMILVVVLGALGVLIIPYFTAIFHEIRVLLPAASVLIGDVIYNGPFAYGVGLVLTAALAIALKEIMDHKSRKCGKPYCKGLRKAVEFDIQLESEDCVKHLPPVLEDVYGIQPLEVGQDHKELEAGLRKMAPPNGRTVLIFRSRCGCPLGRMEVWGPKKLRRIKK